MEILLFGIAREIVGTDKLAVPAEDNITTVTELKTWMRKKFPAIAALTSVAVAVNNEYAEDDTLLQQNSEIAFIPPVSGG